MLVYLSPRDIRKNRSDAVHIVLTANAFAHQLEEVILVTPKIERNRQERLVDIASIFGLSKVNFKLKEIGFRIKENDGSPLFSGLVSISKLIFNTLFLFSHWGKFDASSIIYSKCFISTAPYLIMRKIGLLKASIVFETITPKKSWLHQFVYSNSDGITSHLIFVNDELEKDFDVPKEKIHLLPMISQADRVIEYLGKREQYREEFGLNSDQYYVMYAGKTGPRIKEVFYFIEASKQLPDLQFMIVGANEEAIRLYNAAIEEEKILNLKVLPFQKLEDYYRYVISADLLVGYYPATEHNKYHLSPGKAGVYLASGNPCIFSDLPSLRSIYPDGSVFYAEPDYPKALAKRITEVKNNPTDRSNATEKAMEFASSSDYARFTESILGFINTNINKG